MEKGGVVVAKAAFRRDQLSGMKQPGDMLWTRLGLAMTDAVGQRRPSELTGLLPWRTRRLEHQRSER